MKEAREIIETRLAQLEKESKLSYLPAKEKEYLLVRIEELEQLLELIK